MRIFLVPLAHWLLLISLTISIQRTKLTDLKVEYFKKEEERKSYRRSENSARVFGELWRVLYETKADRVYIVQPHPLGHILFFRYSSK